MTWVTQNLAFLTFTAAVAGALVVGFASGAGRAARYDRNGFVATVALETFSTALALAVNASLRDFGHYYVKLYPWAALLAGLSSTRG